MIRDMKFIIVLLVVRAALALLESKLNNRA